MITQEMLDRAAIDYPIGSIYDDVVGSYKNCLVRYEPAQTGLGIEVGFGYVYWDGKWADKTGHNIELQKALEIIYKD